MTLTQQTAPYAHWEYIHPQQAIVCGSFPERGGIVSEWRCGERGVLYFDQERYADPAKSIRGGIPVLFPICGNLPGDLLQVNGVEHTLKQHGFARNLPWQLQLLDDQSGVRLSLSSNDETLKAYPFAFLMEMELRPVAICPRDQHHDAQPQRCRRCPSASDCILTSTSATWPRPGSPVWRSVV